MVVGCINILRFEAQQRASNSGRIKPGPLKCVGGYLRWFKAPRFIKVMYTAPSISSVDSGWISKAII